MEVSQLTILKDEIYMICVHEENFIFKYNVVKL